MRCALQAARLSSAPAAHRPPPPAPTPRPPAARAGRTGRGGLGRCPPPPLGPRGHARPVPRRGAELRRPRTGWLRSPFGLRAAGKVLPLLRDGERAAPLLFRLGAARPGGAAPNGAEPRRRLLPSERRYPLYPSACSCAKRSLGADGAMSPLTRSAEGLEADGSASIQTKPSGRAVCRASTVRFGVKFRFGVLRMPGCSDRLLFLLGEKRAVRKAESPLMGLLFWRSSEQRREAWDEIIF